LLVLNEVKELGLQLNSYIALISMLYIRRFADNLMMMMMMTEVMLHLYINVPVAICIWTYVRAPCLIFI